MWLKYLLGLLFILFSPFGYAQYKILYSADNELQGSVKELYQLDSEHVVKRPLNFSKSNKVFTYDSIGRCTHREEHTFYEKSHFYGIYSYLFNDAGELSAIKVDRDGKFMVNKELTYNANGQLTTCVEHVKQLEAGKIATVNTAFVYPKKRVTIELHDMHLSIGHRVVLFHDKYNNVTEKRVYRAPDRDKPTVVRRYKYDKEGKRLLSWYDTETKVSESYIYNDSGHRSLKVKTNYNGEASISHYMYKYDVKGNWVERIETSKEGIPLLYTYRKIVYY